MPKAPKRFWTLFLGLSAGNKSELEAMSLSFLSVMLSFKQSHQGETLHTHGFQQSLTRLHVHLVMLRLRDLRNPSHVIRESPDFQCLQHFLARTQGIEGSELSRLSCLGCREDPVNRWRPPVCTLPSALPHLTQRRTSKSGTLFLANVPECSMITQVDTVTLRTWVSVL